MSTLLFPGQGSQIVGMGSEFYSKFKIVKQIFNQADQKLNYSLSKIILEGSEDELTLTQNTQPAILTIFLFNFCCFKNEFDFDFNSFKFFSGHFNCPEYTALVCAKSLEFEDAVYLLHERGKAMQNAVPIGKGSMIAILGNKIDNVKNLIDTRKNKDGVCEIANDNAEGQVIISGDKESINSFQIELKQKKIKFLPLKVSAPFHCSLMKPAADIMKEKIDKTNFKEPKYPIVNNVNALPETDPVKIKDLLYKQIFSTVRWRETLINISKNGISNFIEIGPGKIFFQGW